MESLHGHVELAGLHTRGATVFDWYRASGKAPNVNVVLKIDKLKYADFVKEVFCSSQ